VIRAYLAARWNCSQEREDVTDGAQEIFFQCFKPGGALTRVSEDRPGGFRAYLYGVTRNVAGTLDASRARSRHESLPTTLTSEDPSLSQVFDRAFAVAITREARDLFRARAMRSESAFQRYRALELTYERGSRAEDVGCELGLPGSAVYALVSRARKEFRAILLQVVASYHPEDSRSEIEKRCVDLFAAG
jgi:RNA polymerase sigma-70 factor (ECF subfamily)